MHAAQAAAMNEAVDPSTMEMGKTFLSMNALSPLSRKTLHL